jgi:hypothetical protein
MECQSIDATATALPMPFPVSTTYATLSQLSVSALMAKMQVPDDIWDHIASFISKEALRPLIAVNRPLYNVVMDAEYREVLWAKFDSAMLKSLSRLR